MFSTATSGGGFGGFGSSTPAASTGGFGAAAAPASGFGATTTTASGFGSTTAPAFGATTTPSSGFGATAAPAFGATAAPVSGFGATTPASGFGSTTAPAGGFGTTTAPASGFGSSFGSTGANAFGAKPAQSTPAFGAPAATPSFGFGAATATPATGGFGATTAPAATGSFGGFGAPAATSGTTAPSTGFGGFGSSSLSFGQPAAQNKPTTTFGGFGQTTSFGAPNNAVQMQMPAFGQPAPSTTGKIAKSIEKLQLAYAPYLDMNGKPVAQVGAKYNDDCMFKTYMYDRRNGGVNTTDPNLGGTLLEQAEINNPDPQRYYPVRILGIDALKARFDQQQSESLKLKEHLQSLREVVDSVEVSNTQLETRFSALQMRQAHIYQRLMALLRKIEVLRCRGLPVEESESRYRARLNQLLAAMKGPYLQLQELSNSAAQQDFPQDVYAEAAYDPQEMDALCDALRRQREGLEYVTEILAKDVRDVRIVRSALLEGDTKS